MEIQLSGQGLSYMEITARLLISALISATIGYEREAHTQGAGLRTYMLVSIGSCLLMIIAINLHYQYDGSDPSRIASQIVSGIGFLGAGTIITKSDDILGLTTAAALWVSAGIGIAIGAGMYFAGVITGIVVLIVLTLLAKINIRK